MKERIVLAVAGAVLCVGTLQAQEHEAEANFQNHGRVRLQLGVGDFKIVPGSSDRVVVTWKGRTADRYHASVNVSGQTATVTISGPHSGNNDVHFTIELPPQSDVSAEVAVGDVKVGPFEGNAEVNMGVGDLSVKVLDPNEYAEVTASASIGNVSAGPFPSREEGFLGKSIHWSGHGSHRLKLHVGTGNVNIEKGEAAM
jgi:hypothetical protein